MGDEFCSAESLFDADAVADSNYVFRRVGELCFAPGSAGRSENAASQSRQVLAVAAKHGICVFVDSGGGVRSGWQCRSEGLQRALPVLFGVQSAYISAPLVIWSMFSKGCLCA